MKYILRLILLLIAVTLALPLVAITVREIPNVHLSDARRYVSNPSGILSRDAVERLDETLAELERQTSAEVVVAVVDKVDPSLTPAQMAYQIQSSWGVGKKDVNNGLVMLVSRDDHRAEIVTGRGLEGIIPDVIAGRIIRDAMAPAFKENDFDRGVIAGVDAVAAIISNPENRDEVLSRIAGDEDDLTPEQLWNFYLGMITFLMVGMALWVIFMFRTTRREPLAVRYPKIAGINISLLVLSCLTIGPGFIIYGLYRAALHHIRRRRHPCGNCNYPMTLIDEDHDNDFLTPSQDLEERLNSVDYDVWVCSECNSVDIIPFVNNNSPYKECPRCGARELVLTVARVIYQPTTRREGIGERVYTCRNCGHNHNDRYMIPRKADDSAAIATGAILGSMLGGGSGGGGGFSGGSFGGGSSAGGGAGGSW